MSYTVETMLRMSAKELRRAGLVWPEVLTAEELLQEFTEVDSETNPISARMLRDEMKRRRLDVIR